MGNGTDDPPWAIVSDTEHRRGMEARDRASLLAPWDAWTIQRFWSGEAFLGGSDLIGPAYFLAGTLAARAGRDMARLRTFAARASWEDGGVAAFAASHGGTLGALAGSVLGRGAWEPNPAEWFAEEDAEPAPETTPPPPSAPPPP